MKNLIAVAPILILCSLGCISARNLQVSKSNADNWLDTSIEEMASQCEMKDKEEVFHQLLSEYEDKLSDFIKPIEQQSIGESDFTWHYIYNTDLIDILKRLIKVTQDCLDEERRLDSEGIVTVMHRILKAYAMKIAKVDPINEKDYICLTSPSEPNDLCNELYPLRAKDSKRKMLDILMLHEIENSSCEKNLPYLQCVMEGIKNCSPTIKNTVKVLLSPAEVAICNNYLQETDPEIEEIGEEINDLFKREEKSFSFKKFLRL